MKAIRRCIGGFYQPAGFARAGSIVALLAQVSADFFPPGQEALALHVGQFG